MSELNSKKLPFRGVALSLIVVGAVIATIGAVAWVMSAMWNVGTISQPFGKVIGGVVILALGYVVLELELTRCKA